MSEQVANQNGAPPDRAARFVDAVLERCAKDKGYAARLRRADNPDTEYQCWETLAAFGVDLEKEYQRLPYTTVAAAVAKSKADGIGTLPLGRAIAQCYEDGSKSSQATARLRRLLACDDLPELCRILRPLFSLIDSKAAQSLDYQRLLKQLRFSLQSASQGAMGARVLRPAGQQSFGGGRMSMIASVLHLDRKAVKALRITDPYSLHRVVYSLYADVRSSEAKNASQSSGILFADQGGDFAGRRILLLADRAPADCIDGQYGQVQSKPIPGAFSITPSTAST